MSLKSKVLEIAFAQTNLLRDLGDGFVLRYTTGADPEYRRRGLVRVQFRDVYLSLMASRPFLWFPADLA